MTFFTASIGTIIIRFYLMMAVVIASIFAGLPFLTLLAIPVFLSAMAGITFFPKKDEAVMKGITKANAQKPVAA